MKIKSTYKKLLSDLTTPVGLFLKLRDIYAEVVLLESSDYSSKEESQSFICFQSIANISVNNQQVTIKKGRSGNEKSHKTTSLVDDVNQFVDSFDVEAPTEVDNFIGVFGFTSFDAVEYFDTLKMDDSKPKYNIPQVRYDMFQHIIVFDHFFEQMYIIENLPEGEPSEMEKILNIVNKYDRQSHPFSLDGEERANMSDDDFKKIVTQCKSYCQRGDVFQIVPSRRFSQGFTGDEFNVYRALRSINPSPYLFYFDYGTYKIFGSSPEAQLVVQDRVAEIHPIAGTFKRTGDVNSDVIAAKQLSEDPKENAEHTMLVDLARNDLSKNTTNVKVTKYKEVQYFSHVIHLTSVVEGKLKSDTNAYQIFADTFPAGTLSGAPKFRALELIESLEPTKRGFYGGGLGMISFNGNLNHAIMIRSFLSYEGRLHYQAGAGIVIDSVEESELQEVNNKLAALKKSLQIAEETFSQSTI